MIFYGFPVLLLILSLFPFRTISETCDYISATGKRNPSSYESTKVDVAVASKDHFDDYKYGIPLCVIKDNEPCYPDDFNSKDPNGEYQRLLTYMNEQLGSNNKIPYVPTDLRRSYFEDEFMGFSCKSRNCAANRKCSPCTVVPALSSYDQERQCIPCPPDFLNCRHGERFIQYAEFQRLMRKELLRLLKENLTSVDCSYVGRFRYGDEKKKIERTAARIQIVKDGPVFPIGICSLPDDAKCFPENRDEFMAFKEHLKRGVVISNVFFDPDDNSSYAEPPKNGTENQPILLKSWNCQSGVCHPVKKTCSGRTESYRRVSRIWKLYEYQNLGIRSSPAFGDYPYILTFVGILYIEFTA